MKIALVCPYDWSKPGGVKAHVANLAEFLMARHEVRIFAPTSGRLASDGVDAVVEPTAQSDQPGIHSTPLNDWVPSTVVIRARKEGT